MSEPAGDDEEGRGQSTFDESRKRDREVGRVAVVEREVDRRQLLRGREQLLEVLGLDPELASSGSRSRPGVPMPWKQRLIIGRPAPRRREPGAAGPHDSTSTPARRTRRPACPSERARVASSKSRTMPAAKSAAVSAITRCCPSSTPMPSEPTAVETIGFSIASPSTTLNRVPLPARIGTTTSSACPGRAARRAPRRSLRRSVGETGQARRGLHAPRSRHVSRDGSSARSAALHRRGRARRRGSAGNRGRR